MIIKKLKLFNKFCHIVYKFDKKFHFRRNSYNGVGLYCINSKIDFDTFYYIVTILPNKNIEIDYGNGKMFLLENEVTYPNKQNINDWKRYFIEYDK
jgi:hypothetical protein